MTEQVITVSYGEEIKDGVGKKRVSWDFFILGIIVSLIGYIFYAYRIDHYLEGTGRKVFLYSEYPFQSVGLVVVIVGIVIISIWIVKKVYSEI